MAAERCFLSPENGRSLPFVKLERRASYLLGQDPQNQAFKAVLFFYREILKREVGKANSLRAKRPTNPRHCPTQERR